ncbi:hypothetical protein GF312_03760 [Candidatus Poribacteria bacterium]|nr:hypothetical protein [Candidatus Poribacteria bacterium]
MDNQFSIQEIVEIAIEIEKNGAQLYKSLTELAETSHVKELFSYLTEEEKRHVSRFEEILISLGGYQIPKDYYTLEYMDYMKALADEQVFHKDIKPLEVAKAIKTPLEAVEMAIGFEKDSIIFLYEMRDMVPDNDKESIQKLVNEERDHIRRLSAIKNQIT